MAKNELLTSTNVLSFSARGMIIVSGLDDFFSGSKSLNRHLFGLHVENLSKNMSCLPFLTTSNTWLI